MKLNEISEQYKVVAKSANSRAQQRKLEALEYNLERLSTVQQQVSPFHKGELMGRNAGEEGLDSDEEREIERQEEEEDEAANQPEIEAEEAGEWSYSSCDSSWQFRRLAGGTNEWTWW